jgi:hypothetical protein
MHRGIETTRAGRSQESRSLPGVCHGVGQVNLGGLYGGPGFVLQVLLLGLLPGFGPPGEHSLARDFVSLPR